jgi:hypothetical protein
MKFTASGRRRVGITAMVSASQEVPSGELMTAARYQSAATNAGYQATNEAAHSRQYKALFYGQQEEKKGSDEAVGLKARKKRKSVPTMRQQQSMIQQPTMEGMMQQMPMIQQPMMQQMPMMQGMMQGMMQQPMMSMMQQPMMQQPMMQQPMMMQQQQMMMPMMPQQLIPMMMGSNDSESKSESESESDY